MVAPCFIGVSCRQMDVGDRTLLVALLNEISCIENAHASH